MKFAGLNGPPCSRSSIVLKIFAAFEGISEPVYTCMVISCTVLKQPQSVAAGAPAIPVATIPAIATPDASFVAFAEFFGIS